MAKNKTKIKEIDQDSVLGASKKTNNVEINHWAFLEEIEAPMWADLALEPKLMAEDNDDAWFHTVHSFHQLSARKLRSAFAHPDVGNDFVNFSIKGTCSPKLPSSVSKSRGKDYVSRQWRYNAGTLVSKSHPVTDLGSRNSGLDMGSSQECKSTVTSESKSEASCSVTSVLCYDRLVATVDSDYKIVVGDKVTCGTLNAESASATTVSTSTITTVCQPQQQLHKKSLELSKDAFGQTGGLLNSLKANLIKSYTTRPASRVTIHGDKRQKGSKSFAGKTSIDSSGSGCEGTSKRFSMLSKTDHLNQVDVEMKARTKPPVPRADICDNTEAKDRKSSTGKSSVGSSSIECHRSGKRSSVLSKTDHLNHEYVDMEETTKPVSSADICDTAEERGRKSSTGKSSMGSSSPGFGRTGKRSSVISETYHRKQVKVDININRRLKGHKSSVQSNVGISIRPEVRKMAASSNQSKVRNSSFRGPEKLAQTIQTRVADKGGEASAKNTGASLKQSKPVKSKLSRKAVSPIKGGAKIQRLVEASSNLRSVINPRVDRVESRNAAATSSLKAAKSKVPLQGNSTSRPRLEPSEGKTRVGHRRFNGTACCEKENMKVLVSSQKADAKYNFPVVRASDQKIPKLNSENKVGAALVRSKAKNGKEDNKKLVMDSRVYLR